MSAIYFLLVFYYHSIISRSVKPKVVDSRDGNEQAGFGPIVKSLSVDIEKKHC